MAVLFCIYLMVEEAKSREEDKQGRIRVRIPRSHSMSGLGKTPARFACQPRLGLRLRAPATIYVTYSLRESAIVDLRHKIEL